MHTALFSIIILAPVIHSQRTNHGRFKLPEGTLFGNNLYFSNDVSDATKLLKNLSEIPATEKETAINMYYSTKPTPWQKDAKADSKKILD